MGTAASAVCGSGVLLLHPRLLQRTPHALCLHISVCPHWVSVSPESAMTFLFSCPAPSHFSHCISLSLPPPSQLCRNLASSQPSILTKHLKYAILFRIIYLAISTEVLLCSDPDTGGSLGAASEFEGRSAKPGMILHTRAASWSAAESVMSEHEQILPEGIQCTVLSSPSTAQGWLFFLCQRPGTHSVPAYLHAWESWRHW